jgi:anti-sigma regulatory factor (Ser/Thr protein kinase)
MSLDQTECEGVLDSLPGLLAFVEAACRRAGGDDEACFALKLATEEACVNIITHGYGDGGHGTIRLGFRDEDGRAVLTISDRGRAFAPDQAKAPDLEAGWEEREVGGLGLHLLRSMIDEVEYRSEPASGNTLTLVKRLRQDTDRRGDSAQPA